MHPLFRSLPRHGFLLGIVRNKGLLPHENADLDLMIYEGDVARMAALKWPDFEFWASSGTVPQSSQNGSVGNMYYDGRHPRTGQLYEYQGAGITYTPKAPHSEKRLTFTFSLGILYDFGLPDVGFYPYWCTGWNHKFESEVNGVYVAASVKHVCTPARPETCLGARSLVAPYEVLTGELKLDKGDNRWGKYGYLHRISSWANATLLPFYGTNVLVPTGYKDILNSYYGDTWAGSVVMKTGETEKSTRFDPKPMDAVITR